MNDQPSSSTEPLHEPKIEGQISNSTDECSICRGDEIEDKTVLDSCIHSFCYKCITEWLKYSNGPICPMCKQTINTLQHSLNEIPPKTENAREIFQRAHMDIEVSPEERNIAYQNQFNVRRILRVVLRKYRRLAIDADQNISKQARARNGQEQMTKSENYKRVIIQNINAIQLLKDEITDGSAREFIFLQNAFRKLIYAEKLKLIKPHRSSGFLFSSNATNIADFREKMVPFLVDEFKAIPVKYHKGKEVVPTEFVHDKFNGRDEEMANRIVTFIQREGIEKSSSASKLSEMINARTQDVLILCDHIRAYAHHHGSFFDFLKNVDYSLPEVLPSSSSRSGLNGDQDEVVLDDEDEPDEPVYVQSNGPNLLSRLQGSSTEDWIRRVQASLGFNPITTSQIHPAINLRSMFNVGSHHSTSESDGDSQLYERPQLMRALALSNAPRNNLSRVDSLPTGAQSWNELTSDYHRPRPQSNDDSVVVISDDDVSPINSNSGNNASIILDEFRSNHNQPSSSRHRHRRVEKRKLTDERDDGRNKRISDNNIPPGFNDAMYKLLTDYGMSRSADIDKITSSAELTLRKIRAERRANVDALASSSSPSTSSEDRSSQNT